MNLGIIGYGNIGSMICGNLIDIGFLDENILSISTKTLSKLEGIDSRVNVCKDNVELAKQSDIIFISVKTPDLIKVIEEIAPFLDDDSYLVHSSAGIDFDEICNVYDGEVSCVIPSIASEANPSRQKSGISIFHHGEGVCEDNRKMIEGLFSQFSNVIATDSYDELSYLTVATSCMPAFIALATDLLARKLAESSGIGYGDLWGYLNETNLSTAGLLELGLFDSKGLIEKIATKKGITQKGLDYLEEELPQIFDNLMGKLLDKG